MSDASQLAAGTGISVAGNTVSLATGLNTSAPWMPGDNGLLIANSDPLGAVLNNSPANGTLYLMKLVPRTSFTLAHLWFILAGGGSGSSTGTFVGVYSAAGTRLTGSSDIASQLGSGEPAECALTTPQALTAGTFVWAALLVNMPSSPTLYRGLNDGDNVNVGLTAATARFATNGTGLTALPSSITPASNSTGTSDTWWVGGN